MKDSGNFPAEKIEKPLVCSQSLILICFIIDSVNFINTLSYREYGVAMTNVHLVLSFF